MIITIKKKKQQNDILFWVGSGVGGIRKRFSKNGYYS